MNDTTNAGPQCPECKRFPAIHGHDIGCSLQTLEDWKAQALHYHALWLAEGNRFHATLKRHLAQAVFWQGKWAIVKAENNALRKRLFPQPKPKPKPPA